MVVRSIAISNRFFNHKGTSQILVPLDAANCDGGPAGGVEEELFPFVDVACNNSWQRDVPSGFAEGAAINKPPLTLPSGTAIFKGEGHRVNP